MARFHAARRQRIAAGTAREYAGRILLDSTALDDAEGRETAASNTSFTAGRHKKSFLYCRTVRTEGVRAERMIRYARNTFTHANTYLLFS